MGPCLLSVPSPHKVTWHLWLAFIACRGSRTQHTPNCPSTSYFSLCTGVPETSQCSIATLCPETQSLHIAPVGPCSPACPVCTEPPGTHTNSMFASVVHAYLNSGRFLLLLRWDWLCPYFKAKMMSLAESFFGTASDLLMVGESLPLSSQGLVACHSAKPTFVMKPSGGSKLPAQLVLLCHPWYMTPSGGQYTLPVTTLLNCAGQTQPESARCRGQSFLWTAG